jgi:hypothetical protein
MRATLHTDGAARRQLAEPTGPAGIGAVLRSESGEVIGEIARGIGLATNGLAIQGNGRIVVADGSVGSDSEFALGRPSFSAMRTKRGG